MSFPRYPAYKPSGVEWLGPVPEHWQMKKMRHLSEAIEQGWSPQCENEPSKGDSPGVLKVGCVNGGRFRPMENKRLPDEIEPVLEYAIKRGDLLVSRANTRELVGCAAVALQDYPWLFICDKIYRLTLKTEEAIPSHVAAYLSSRQARGQIELGATGASQSMQNISQDVIRNLSIPLPCVKEQQAIANFLDRETAKIDALIAEQQCLIELLQEKRQSVISHAVTKGLNPNAPMKDSGVEWLGEVPEHWEMRRVKDVCSITGGGTPSRENLQYWGGDIPWVSPKDVKNERVCTAQEFITREGLDCSTSSLVEKGALLMVVRSGILKHTIPVAINTVSVAINQDIKALTFHEETMNPFYAMRLIQGFNNPLLLCWAKQGATVESVEQEYLQNTLLSCPPLPEQLSILAALDKALCGLDQLITEAGLLTKVLRERRSALISAAVTGQIDVRGLATEEAA